MAHDRVVVALYAWLTRFLPPDMQGERGEMLEAFRDLASDDRREGRGGWEAWRRLAALPPVLAMEWLEFMGVRPAPGRHDRIGIGRGSMGWFRNLRFAVRTLRKAPAFAVTSVLLMAVGVGAVTAIYTLVDHVLLRPLPYPAADRLVAVDRGSHSGPLFQGMEEFNGVEEWGAARTERVNLVGQGAPARLELAMVSDHFFDLFGARAQRGRLLEPDDFPAPSSVVVSAEAWRRIWGADPDLVGRTISVNGHSLTVVGVLEDGFAAPEALVGRQVDLWLPLDWASAELTQHDYSILEVAGRMKPGVTLVDVQDEMDDLLTRMASVHGNYTDRDGSPRVLPVLALADQTVRSVRAGLGLLMGAVGLLLLVACANVAHLFLARGLGRTREMAVRRAMGAGTGALAQQLLVESLVVGIAGGAVGTALAMGGLRAFVALNPTALPRQASVTVDPGVLLFVVGVSAATSLVFGLLPALRSMRGKLADELRGGGRSATAGRGTGLLRNGLVTAEVALSLVLVAGAGLLLRSFMAVRAQDPGFAVAGVWTIPINLPEPDSPDAYRETMDEILRQVAGVPGVRSAAYALTAPLDRTGGSRCCWRTSPSVPGREAGDQALQTMMHPVTAGYFETAGIRIVAGAGWGGADVHAEPVPVVVNETYARELAGSVSAAVGTSITFGAMEARVVGVAVDNRHYGLDQPVGKGTYIPVERLPFPITLGTVMARVDPGAEGSLPATLREAVWAAEPGLPIPTVRTMQEALEGSTAGRRFESVMFGVFASIALLLAAGGLYGTLLYMAGQRRKEMGIRVALGASRSRIEGEVLRRGIAVAGLGVVVGLAGAWGANRLLESRVWGVDRGDPWALGGAAAILMVTAVVASWLPARRAGRVDPLEALRME